MTPEEIEDSTRKFEIAGTLVCAGLTMLFFLLYVSFVSAINEFDGYGSPGSFAVTPISLAVLLVTASSYGFIFYGLDRWRRGFFKKFKSDIRINWFAIPFLGAFFSFANNELLLSRFYGITDGDWLLANISFTIVWGILTWFVMLLFWGVGCAMRRSQEQANISITQL